MSTSKLLVMQEQFVLFSKFGDPRSDGRTITLTQSDKWMKQALVLDGKKVTLTDTGVCFNKFKSRTINYQDFMRYIDDLAKEKGMDTDELKHMMLTCGPPGTSKITSGAVAGSKTEVHKS
ncbi:PREDICTED: TPPP family protein CG45057-like [Nicrophorus vespilloides]|uniref:TPPP family protein CG45057-like n=1 Tax=Nicrophorus vespilloides TaxID=110193 RepID=A0ABM1MUP8_NICVS|nr:PREDICTED: TPPP family protein CG45057-like [Nicrophorus vespilloides]